MIRIRFLCVVTILVFLAGVFLPGQVVQAASVTTTLISVTSDGTQANDDSQSASISSNGRYVAFQSTAGNLAAGDMDGTWDIFVHDRLTGTTTPVSVNSSGVLGDLEAIDPSISADGRYVAFRTFSALVAEDTNNTNDIYVHDCVTGATTRVSVASDGTQGDKDSLTPSISPDGQFVAFASYATTLVDGDTNFAIDIFVHDRDTGVTTRASVNSDEVQANNNSYAPSISLYGSYVAFESIANNLVTGDANGAKDVFVRSLVDGVTTRVSVASDGTPGSSISDTPSISSDGNLVAFHSYSPNLVSGDSNGKRDIFVHDRATGATTRVSVSSGGVEGNDNSYAPSLSPDGNHVAFVSNATNLVSGGSTLTLGVFVHDRISGTTVRVSVASDGSEGYGTAPSISSNGSHVAFESSNYSLVPDDNNGASDIFVRGEAFPSTLTLCSTGTQDGYILESGETTNVGGTMNSTATTLRLGDDATKKQYRSLLSFDTGAALPDNAVITKVTLKVKRQTVVGGGNPITTFQGFMLDIRKGTFGTSVLQTADFQTTAHKTVGPFSPALVGGWYEFNLTSVRAYINKLATLSGLTQIRLRFKLDDNNNNLANYLSLYSGNAGAAARPMLVIEYYIP